MRRFVTRGETVVKLRRLIPAAAAGVVSLGLLWAASDVPTAPTPPPTRKKPSKVPVTIVVLGPASPGSDDPAGRARYDAAALLHLTLTSSLRSDVRSWPDLSEGPEVLHVWPAVPESATGARLADALALARNTLAPLPRSIRKPALKQLGRFKLESLERREGDSLLDALRARSAGDPQKAAALLRSISGGSGPPVVDYLLGATLVEAGDLQGAAAAFSHVGKAASTLPSSLRTVERATALAAAGRVQKAHGEIGGAVAAAPSLVESRGLRASLSRSLRSLYDPDRIGADWLAALRSNPCCPECALAYAESQAFTGRPERAVLILSREAPCDEGAMDSARARAEALALAASGRIQEALEKAAEAESRDAGPLRSGLAQAFMLAGDHGHLDEAYDSEGDARLPLDVSVEQHLHSGLNDLWTGRPSEAAVQLERAEEHLTALTKHWEEPPALLDLIRALRIRSYLVAGRASEAARLVEQERSRSAGRLTGFLGYTASLSDLAEKGPDAALANSRAQTSSTEKFWRYLIVGEAMLAKGRLDQAWDQVNLALMGINTQTTIAPGISTEPYLLDLQSRILLASGRDREALRLIERVLALGPRGLHAPDVVVPAWALAGRARQMLGDREGARTAYGEVVKRWGSGEGAPALTSARAALDTIR